MKKTLIFLLLTSFAFALSQNFSAYQFYDKNGKKVSAEKVAKDLAKYDIVFFGEHHNNSINHWLQLKLTQALFKVKKDQLILGAEMFERDNQAAINQYLLGEIENKSLKDSVRLWSNFKTDYQPLLDFAKNKKLRFIATNIPRKYASQVAKFGLESLNSISVDEKNNMANLPIKVTLETPGYKEMKTMMGDHADLKKSMNFVSAQAIKDATMAQSILENYNTKNIFLHYNGDYHTKQYGGIYWYIKQQRPDLKMAVISVFESDDSVLKLPVKDWVPTEYNLVLPSDMAKTY